MLVSTDDIRVGIRQLGLAESPVCLHSSLRSFGRVDGGAPAVVDAFLHEGCTLLVPAFSWIYAVSPPKVLQFERNGADYEYLSKRRPKVDRVFGRCSDGFLKLAPALSRLVSERRVGASLWQVFPAARALAATTQAILDDPLVTHCANRTCGRCRDAVAGGPILT